MQGVHSIAVMKHAYRTNILARHVVELCNKIPIETAIA